MGFSSLISVDLSVSYGAMAMGCLVVNASGVLPGVATGIQGVAYARWRLRQQDGLRLGILHYRMLWR